MYTQEITYDVHLWKSMFSKFFLFRKQKEFKKIPKLLILPIILFVVGFALKISLLKILSGLSLTVLLAYFLAFRTKLNNLSKAYLNQIDQQDFGTYTFGFDHEKFWYEGPKLNAEKLWKEVHFMEQNEGYIYIYNEKRELLEIFSKELISEEAFEQIFHLLKRQFNK